MTLENIADLEALRKKIEEADGDLLLGEGYQDPQMLASLRDGMIRTGRDRG